MVTPPPWTEAASASQTGQTQVHSLNGTGTAYGIGDGCAAALPEEEQPDTQGARRAAVGQWQVRPEWSHPTRQLALSGYIEGYIPAT